MNIPRGTVRFPRSSEVDNYRSKERPAATESGVGAGRRLRTYLILYVRSPSALLDNSIFSPLFFPRMLTKPGTVCGSQPVVFMISTRIAPLARFISAITSTFLLERSVLGLGVFAGFPFFSRAWLLAGLPLWLRLFGLVGWHAVLDCIGNHLFS